MASKVKEAHSALEWLLTQALVNKKTGEASISVPYYELDNKPKDFKQVYLIIEIKTFWDDSKVLSDEQEDLLYEHTKKAADSGTKH